ncbi:MAG: hypothetical protein P8I33_04050 [Paracoccaceae bacterium]|nr:hypothetical protein [Paracoccaceae bacterium]
MLDWFSEERAFIASLVIVILIITLVASVIIGLKQARFRSKDEVFGDPERTLGGWYWTLTGVSTILLLWFYFSWGVGRAFFPEAGNEMCQVAKVETAIAPVKAALPIGARYYKSTKLIIRNNEQLDILESNIPRDIFDNFEQKELLNIISSSRELIGVFSNPLYQDEDSKISFENLVYDLNQLSFKLDDGHKGLIPSKEALAQAKWGTTYTELPLLPITSKGILFDDISEDVKLLSKTFLKIRNRSETADNIIRSTKEKIKQLKNINDSTQIEEDTLKRRQNFVKAVERIFKRLDDGTIFPPQSLNELNSSVNDFLASLQKAKGNLNLIQTVLIPGRGVVKSKTQCTEQGSGRWLPKPTDVVAKFLLLANPNLESGGGYKGTTLFWWSWLEIADIFAFLIPDSLIDYLPGEYGQHSQSGKFEANYKDILQALAQGDIYLGAIPMFDGHIWDSLFRVMVALALGILLGVPLGIYMGISRFFKSFFDPIIELYRPVPPLAWAPLILTIFGIQDDGKIFLLFMWRSQLW